MVAGYIKERKMEFLWILSVIIYTNKLGTSWLKLQHFEVNVSILKLQFLLEVPQKFIWQWRDEVGEGWSVTVFFPRKLYINFTFLFVKSNCRDCYDCDM